MKRIVYILIFVFAGLSVHAQQLPLYSQYMFNRYALNPAVAGTNDFFMATSNNRYQWVGVTDAPRTYILSVHGPHKTKNIGLGGAIYTDVTGPTSRTGAYVSYSHHFQVNDYSYISLGLSGGLLQFKVDGSEIVIRDPGDLVLTNSVQSALVPDFGFGAYWYGEKFYVGLSVPQFIQNKLKFFETETQTLSKLTSHYFLNAGNKFTINYDWEIEPSVLLRWTYPVVPQVDFGARAIYQDYIWAGFNYRTQDAISFLIGYKTKNDKLLFGYAYDKPLTNISNYSFGTHEIMVAAKFSSIKTGGSKFVKRWNRNKMDDAYVDADEINNDDAENISEVKTSEQRIKEYKAKDKKLRSRLREIRQIAADENADYKDPSYKLYAEYQQVLDAIHGNYKDLQRLESLSH